MLLSASEIITRTLKTFTDHFASIAKFMLMLGLSSVALETLKGVEIPVWYSGNPFLILLVNIAVALAIAFLTFWLQLALIKSLGEAYQNKQVESFFSALKSTKSCFWSASLAGILYWLMVFFGGMLLIIPGIIFAFWYLFFLYAIIFEEKKTISGLSRSKELVVGRFWSIFWRAVAPTALLVVLLSLAQTILIAPFQFMGEDALVYIIISNILSVLSRGVFLALTTLSLLILYFNVRESKALQEQKII